MQRIIRIAILCLAIWVAAIAYVWYSPQGRTFSIAADGHTPLFDNRTPKKYTIDLATLPPPFATPSAHNQPFPLKYRPKDGILHVPPGFKIAAWSTDVHAPRAMALAPNGDVFVVESAAHRVVVLREANGKVTRTVYGSDFRLPFGIAFYPVGPHPKYLYIANTDSVVRFPYRDGDVQPSGPSETIVPELPARGYNNHWTRRLAFSPDSKKLYISVGSAGNADEEPAPRACILECNPDGSGLHVYASGLRNAVGLNFSPVTGKLWTAVNERDDLGDLIVPDYATSVQPGGFYGWPNYYMGPNHDPRLPERPDLRSRVVVPDVPLEAHCAALSIAFDTGGQFPKQYRNDAFVGLHGSWNRSERSGYKVVRLLMRPDGSATGSYEDFVWGWALRDGTVWGRPVDVLFLADGSLLISDDSGNCIWRVTYAGK